MKHVVDVARAMGREIATPAEAREILPICLTLTLTPTLTPTLTLAPNPNLNPNPYSRPLTPYP